MTGTASLIDELERTLSAGSSVQRADILRRVSDLFLTNIDHYGDEHVAVFDDVMLHLVDKIERSALVRLSKQLAPIENAPVRTVHRLADDVQAAFARNAELTFLRDQLELSFTMTLTLVLLFSVFAALWTALYASHATWALYNGLVAYLLMGALFAGEWWVRQRVRARHA